MFWITVVWKDKLQDDGMPHDAAYKRANLECLQYERSSVGASERRRHTLERAETMVQAMIWDAARRLKNPSASVGTG